MAGPNWGELIRALGPIVGGIAAGGGPSTTGFMRGYSESEQMLAQERAQQAREQQNKLAAGSKFKLDLFDKLMALDDPMQFEQLRRMGAEAGAETFGLDPTDFDFQFPDSKRDAKKLKALTDLIDDLEKRGYDMSQLEESGSELELADGVRVPVSDAIRLTRRNPVGSGGQTIHPPKKTTSTTGTETERASQLLEAIDAAEAIGDEPAAAKLRKQYDNLLRAKKEMGQSDDRPLRAPDAELGELNKTLKQLQIDAARDRANKPPSGANGLTSEQVRTAAGLRDDFRTETKDYRVQRDGYERVLSSAKDPSAAGDMALLFAYMKVLDPGSVVRESEFATAARSGSLPQQIQAAATKIVNGQRLTPEQRADFVARSKGIFDRVEQRQRRMTAKYRNLAGQMGIPGELVIVDDADMGAIEDGPTIGERRMINGVIGEWDGKGWKAVR